MEEHTLQSPLVLSSVSRTAIVKVDADEFKNKIKEEARMHSAAEFLYVIRRIHKLHNINPITDLCMFKEGIQPMWEDPSNINGGKWVFKLKKNTIDQRMFEKMVVWMALKPFATMEVNGILISVRTNLVILSFWTKECPAKKKDKDLQEKEIRDTLDLNSSILITFKKNEDSLKDKSSFRNLTKEQTSSFK
jgi:translation initiation factor 4E